MTNFDCPHHQIGEFFIATIIRLERISTLKNAGTVTIFRNGSVHYDSHIRLTVGQLICLRKYQKISRQMDAGTCFMSFTNYPMDEQLCRVLSVSHSNSIHEVDNMTNDLNPVFKVVLRGSISYNTEFQRPLQYKLELRHLPDNYTFMVLEDAMYSVQVNIKF